MSSEASEKSAHLPATIQDAATPAKASPANTSPALRLKIDEKTPGRVRFSPDGPDQASAQRRWMEALGTSNPEFATAMLTNIAGIGAAGPEQSAATLNATIALVQGIAPRDETEAMLAVQMAAIHNATIKAARYLEAAQTRPQHESYSNVVNKLARTFTGQMETLKRYRSTGEQSIRVQHVTVNEGGQAIVGQVTAGGGAPEKTGGQSLGPSRIDECRPTLLGHVQALEATMPSPSREGLQSVPLPRRQSRGAKGRG